MFDTIKTKNIAAKLVDEYTAPQSGMLGNLSTVTGKLIDELDYTFSLDIKFAEKLNTFIQQETMAALIVEKD